MVSFEKNTKNITLWLIVGLLVFSLMRLYYGGGQSEVRILPLSEFIHAVKQGAIKQVTIQDQDLYSKSVEGISFATHIPHYYNPTPMLEASGVNFRAAPADNTWVTLFALLLHVFLPMGVLVGAWIFFFRQTQGGAGRAMSFGRSRARIADPQNNNTTFDDVAGADEAKQQLGEIIDFLRDPRKFHDLGGVIPRGVLLEGPPGTGKTLLARAVAGEADVPFFAVSGSDFVEMFVGVGASRVRDLFAQAKQHAPCIIFIDEIDAVGGARVGGVSGGSHDEREQTLNQLLVEMGGFEENRGIVVIAATNRAEALDKALLRPGRFDRHIYVGLPDMKARYQILAVHLKKIRHISSLNVELLARRTPGFSGADLANFVNEAALRAATMGHESVMMEDFEFSLDKIIMGTERKTLAISPSERELTAYHEAGHALLSFYCPNGDPIHKATIIPRSKALGMVVRIPDGDRVSMSLRRLKEDLIVLMGGRVAESLIFGEESITTGASGDFAHATDLAYKMVFEWGMSPLGVVHYTQDEGFFGKKNHSEDVWRKGDAEVRTIVENAYNTARNLLSQHMDQLHALARALLARETLTGHEIHTLLTTGHLPPDSLLPSVQEEKIQVETVPIGDRAEGCFQDHEDYTSPYAHGGNQRASLHAPEAEGTQDDAKREGSETLVGKVDSTHASTQGKKERSHAESHDETSVYETSLKGWTEGAMPDFSQGGRYFLPQETKVEKSEKGLLADAVEGNGAQWKREGGQDSSALQERNDNGEGDDGAGAHTTHTRMGYVFEQNDCSAHAPQGTASRERRCRSSSADVVRQRCSEEGDAMQMVSWPYPENAAMQSLSQAQEIFAQQEFPMSQHTAAGLDMLVDSSGHADATHSESWREDLTTTVQSDGSRSFLHPSFGQALQARNKSLENAPAPQEVVGPWSEERKDRRLRKLASSVQRGLCAVLPEILEKLQRQHFPEIVTPFALGVVLQRVTMGHPSQCIAWLVGEQVHQVLRHLNQVAPYVRHKLTEVLHMRYVPQIRFRFDEEEGRRQRMHNLLQHIQTDLVRPEEA